MSAVVEVREPSARDLSALQPKVVQHFELMATAPGGVARLRELILTLAVQGKLVPQDPKDEPASELLKKIREEKDRLIAQGKIKREKPQAEIADAAVLLTLPVGWECSNLSTIGVINPRNVASDESIASFVQMSSIPVAFSEPHIAEPRSWRDIKSGFTQFAEGDVGVAKITPCFENGKSTVFQNLSNGIGAGTTELHIVRPLGGIEPRYVLLFMKTPAFLSGGEAVMTGSAGQKRMPRSYFENTPFPLPPLAEQARIVTRVEELMRLCDALEAKGQLEAAQHALLVQTLLGALTASATPDELADNWQRVATHFDLLLDRPEAIDALEQTILQLAVRGLLVPQDPKDEPASVLLQKIRVEKDRLIAEGKIKRDKSLAPIAKEEQPAMLPQGWAVVRFGDYFFELCTGPFGSVIHKEDYVDGGVPLINPSHMVGGRILHDPSVSVSLLMAGQLGAYRLTAGDVVLARRGEVGRYALVTKVEDGWLCGTGSFFVKLHECCNRGFLGLIMEDPDLRMHLLGESVGSTMTNLNQRILIETPIALPPLAEQSRIVTRVESLRRLCADIRQRLAARQTTQAHLAEALIAEVG